MKLGPGSDSGKDREHRCDALSIILRSLGIILLPVRYRVEGSYLRPMLGCLGRLRKGQ